MYKIIFIIIAFISSSLLAQVSGKSKPGKLFGKTNTITKDISAPKIIIIDPEIQNGKAVVDENRITLQGKIEDKYGIKRFSVNRTSLSLISDNKFYYNIDLKDGLNNIFIEAENNMGKTASLTLSVELKSVKKVSAKIVLSEPNIDTNNEIITENGFVTIRGTVKNAESINLLKINSSIATLDKNGKFYYEISLQKQVTPVNIKAFSENEIMDELNFNIIYHPLSSVPVITIIEPKLSFTNEITHDESIITIRGKIEDIIDIRTIEVNNQPAALLGKNEFFANVSLNDGINNVLVKAINIKGKSAEKLIRIITPIDDIGPEITIYEPSVSRGLKIVRKKDVLSVRGKVIDRSGILNVTVNNREVTLLPNKEFSAKIYLGMGDNTITVRATDRKYNVTADTFYVTRKLEDVVKTGKYIALIIGINSYEGYWHPLSNAVNDARELAEVLRRDYYFNEIHTIIDKEATRRNIIQKMEWIINNSTNDDNILIFYAGHGQFKRSLNKGYWVPVDATTNSTADYISNNDIKTFIGGIPSKHTFLITDACFAGDIFRGKKTETIPFDPSDMTKYYREVYNKPSRLALTSGSLEQVSDAGKDNHSIFTYFLLKSLKENKQKYLDASQLFNDFRMAVTNNSDQTPQLQVVRDTNDEGGQFIFIKKE